MPRPPEYAGPKLSIECMERVNGSCPAGAFLDELPKKSRTKLDVIFELLGDNGRIQNVTKFKKIEDGIFEIKSHQVRIFCFFTSDRRLILLYGLMKKRDQHKRKDIDKASRMRDDFLHRQECE